jgi:hypothetical protein
MGHKKVLKAAIAIAIAIMPRLRSDVAWAATD